MKKLNIAILFGGKSTEHEVSIMSAKNILKALDPDKYNISLIGIDKTGKWFLTNNIILENFSDKELALIPGQDHQPLIHYSKGQNTVNKFDAVIPAIHGTYGEDGSVQGMLKIANIPFVGCDVLGSAIGMDKDVSKRLLQAAGIKVANCIVYEYFERNSICFDDVKGKLGVPFFVKAANLGSSVGVNKVTNAAELEKAIEEAFLYDNKLLIEEAIDGREIECSIMGGNGKIEASVPGEVIQNKNHEFYSYEAKYLDESGAVIQIPADIEEEKTKEIQELAKKVFKTLSCYGLARVDMFLTKDGNLIINEINTLPGFTDISMYPKLWEYSGKSTTQLLDELIELAIVRNKRENNLLTSYKDL